MRGAEGDLEEERSSGVAGLLLLAALLVAAYVGGGLYVLVMILGLVVMIFLHELGHFVTAKAAGMKVTEFFLGFGPRLWSFRRGETEYGVKAIPAGAYVRIIGMSNLDPVEPGDEGRTYLSKPYWRRLSVAVAGSTMHFLMAFVLILVLLGTFGLPDLGSHRWTVRESLGPAKAAGLEVGDRILSIDGRPRGSYEEVTTYLRAHPGETVDMVVERHGRRVSLSPRLGSHNPSTGEDVGYLGVRPSIPDVPVTQAPAVMGRTVTATFTALGQLFSPNGVSEYVDTVRNGGTDASGNAVDRPTSIIGLVRTGSTAGFDWAEALFMLFVVNVFVGIFNLTPILPFDGGHVVIATYEKVRSMLSGREYHADITKLMPFAYAVIMALALLFLSTAYLDIFHWHSPGS